METKTKVILIIIGMAAAFASGRYLSPEKVRTEVKTVEIEKIVDKVIREVITVVERPDGTKETKTERDTKSHSETDSRSSTSIVEKSGSKDKLNISALVGAQLPMSPNSMLYGASISKNIIGPVTFGFWALTNKSSGISIGLNF